MFYESAGCVFPMIHVTCLQSSPWFMSQSTSSGSSPLLFYDEDDEAEQAQDADWQDHFNDGSHAWLPPGVMNVVPEGSAQACTLPRAALSRLKEGSRAVAKVWWLRGGWMARSGAYGWKWENGVAAI